MVEKQNEFASRVAKLILWATYKGYQVSFGEAFRPEWVAEEYKKKGMGIARSLHTDRLAVDLNFFHKNMLLLTVADLLPIGEFWESLSTPELPSYWGGRFESPDAGHFSVSTDTRK